ncbi:AAA family ATPase [Rhodotorula toruloides]|uniref:AAA family ATPase n=1 Tax=Rhodotorula toruloides TaxID=5286 RepID=A0A511K7C8_RHOTO|nr:AAA family ATPase [Rhodotorula toruloides]
MASDRPRRAASQRRSTAEPDHPYSSHGQRAAGSRRSARRSSREVNYAGQDDDDDDEYFEMGEDASEEDGGSGRRSTGKGKAVAYAEDEFKQEERGEQFEADEEEYRRDDLPLHPQHLPPLPPAHPAPNSNPLVVKLNVARTATPATPVEAPPLADDDADAEGEEDADAAGEDDPDAYGAPHAGHVAHDAYQNGQYAAAAGADDGSDEEGVGGGRRLRPRRQNAIHDSEDSASDANGVEGHSLPPRVFTTTSSGRQTRRPVHYGESGEEEDHKPDQEARRGGLRRGRDAGYRGDGIEPDDEWDGEDSEYGERRGGGGRSRRSSRRTNDRPARQLRSSRAAGGAGRSTRNSRKAVDQSYEQDEDETELDTDEEMLDLQDDDDDSLGRGEGAGKRKLRNKPRINYYVPPPNEVAGLNAGRDSKGKGKQRRTDEDGNPFAGLPANMTGAQWAALYPEGGQPGSDSSDDENPNMSSPRKAALFSGPGAAVTGGMLAGGGLDFGSGAPSNLGKVNNVATLADTDPLGVPTSISFDSVGGLGQHIQQLKEMVSLPLLYPEVFERFNITPPRGVLFHGPPGTGKTLLARALAASCSTEGRKISFFMRKGADCLSKWVGEAERQLRLLFEEARACQPSIIFFDEIDGLAPVRSSKQEQIHASIVSTLLALMDGMDGRGQVIVIGATNRPDAIDPALRRPGRFDREFYFPLPNLEARRKIIDIHTEGWNPPLEDGFRDELAKLTKGYGGADLRALCTEAALNAVQRTYPQIYKTNDRLLIKPEQIEVTARDFTISQKNLIPSTARSTSSHAAPLPSQLVPLLADSLEHAKTALAKVLPEVKKVNVLEEAEFVDEGAGFEKEKMLQAFETLRVFRPRLIICGEPGMGQAFVGAAILQHLEGFHVQTLDLATLVSDSTRTMEAACVQLFVEAKRHKPSILFIPSLVTWCASVGETVRSTIKGLLDGLDPSDPILLLAVVDGHFSEVPADVRSWFGFVKGNRVIIGKPSTDQRRAFFEDVIAGIQRPPNEYPDGVPRRKRVFEKLPLAPPPPPRAPTAAEITQQQQNDLRLLEYLKWRLGPVLSELKKRYKRFQRSLYKDWQSDDLEWRQEQLRRGQEVTGLGKQPYHNVDLDTMASDLYKGFYYTPDDFLDDILRIQHNAEVNKIMENDAEAPVRAGQMVNHVKVMLDQTFDSSFRAECGKMAERMREKEKDAPRKGRRRGRGGSLPPEDGAVAAAETAAAAGGAFKERYNARTANGAEDSANATDTQEMGEEGDAERQLKRARAASGEHVLEAEQPDEHGPAKRQRTEVEGDQDEQMRAIQQHQAAVDMVDGQAAASTSSAPNGFPAGFVAAQPQAGPAGSLHDLLNPTTSSSLAAFADPIVAFSEPQQNPFAPTDATVAPPMAVGAAPSEATAAAGLPAPEAAAASSSFLSGTFPATAASANLFGVLAVVQDALSVNGNSALPSRDGTPTPIGMNGAPVSRSEAGSARQASAEPEKERTPTPEPTPPPPPPFVVPAHTVDSLYSFLIEKTDALNIDQLEQLRAACYDAVWRGRTQWDRTTVVQELDDLAKEFVEEVEALAA